MDGGQVVLPENRHEARQCRPLDECRHVGDDQGRNRGWGRSSAGPCARERPSRTARRWPLGYFISSMWLNSRQTARRKAFEEELPDFLMLLASALRSGLSFQQGLDSSAAEGRGEVSRQMRRALREAQMGSILEPALGVLQTACKVRTCAGLCWHWGSSVKSAATCPTSSRPRQERSRPERAAA